jgi:ABC-type transport system involved in cytochrome c biogenesis permease subunit
MTSELQLLWLALMLYTLAGSTAIGSMVLAKRPEQVILALIMVGLAVHAASIGLRWERIGHGPFITMFEILSSNVWSLLVIYALAYWRMPAVRPAAVVVMPILLIMMTWLLLTSPAAGHFPPTYRTVWLYVHMLFGKIFLGTVLVAVGVSGLILLRHAGLGAGSLTRLPDDVRLEDLAFRFIMVGFIFESLMLVAGAIWAQDAWGRYWAWDPLETWAFATWLTLVFGIHLRVTVRLRPRQSAVLIMAMFVLAFLTFFGVPFISTAPHKGAV